MIISIDLDDTLRRTKSTYKYRIDDPVDGALAAVKEMQDAGHTLVVLTAHKDLDEAKKWLLKFGLDLPVSNIKQWADCYIDDRAIRFESWPDALIQIGNLSV